MLKKTLITGLAAVMAMAVLSPALAAPGPNANTIQIQTYGALPVVMINLTPFPATVTLSQQNWQMYTSSPLAVGVSGIYYQTSSNPVTINGIGGAGTPTLSPAVNPINAQTTSTQSWASNSPYITHFVWFPSWTNTNQIGSTQVVALGGLLATSSGLALGVPGVDPATYGYPTSNWQAWQSQNTAVNVQSMGNNSTGTMNITLNLAAGGDTNSGDSTVYNIYLNSQGLQNRQMSPQYTPPTSGVNMMNYLNGLWNVMITADAFISADPVAITGALLGDYQSIAGLVKSGASGQAGNSNKAYTVAYGPFIAYADNCTVTQGGVSIPFSQDMVNGDNNALLYDPNATMSTTNLNIFLRNQLVLIDFRQFTYENGVFAGLTTADTLYVAIINEAVQAAATAATMTQANALGQVDMVALNSNATPQQVTERRQMATRIYAAIAALNKINPRLAEAFADKFSFRAVTALEQLTPAEKKLAMKKLLTEAEEILKEIKKTDPGFNLNLI